MVTRRTRVGRLPRRSRFIRPNLNRRRNQRRMGRTVVTVSNHRPRAPQRNVLPLNYGAGGTSTTFRVVDQVQVSNLTDKQLASTAAATYSSNVQLTYSDILTSFPNLAKHYKQIRILRVSGTLVPSAGMTAKSSIGFSLTPRNFTLPTPTPTIADVDTWLSSGTVVVKKAYIPTVSTWIPTEPEDWEYLEFDDSGKVNGNDVVCNAIIVLLGLASDFLFISKDASTLMNRIELGLITWDVQVHLRGRQSSSAVLRSSHVRTLSLVSHDLNMISNSSNTDIRGGDSSDEGENLVALQNSL